MRAGTFQSSLQHLAALSDARGHQPRWEEDEVIRHVTGMVNERYSSVILRCL